MSSEFQENGFQRLGPRLVDSTFRVEDFRVQGFATAGTVQH